MLGNTTAGHTALSRMNMEHIQGMDLDLNGYPRELNLASVAADVSDSMITSSCHNGFGTLGGPSALNLDQSDLGGDADAVDAYHSTYSGLSATG
jgi:hypothetical protein